MAGAVWASLACALVGMFGSLDILFGGLFDCTQEKKIEGLHAFLRGINDGFGCYAGILIILLFSFFFFSFLF